MKYTLSSYLQCLGISDVHGLLFVLLEVYTEKISQNEIIDNLAANEKVVNYKYPYFLINAFVLAIMHIIV